MTAPNRDRDPLGKSALFSAPGASSVSQPTRTKPRPEPQRARKGASRSEAKKRAGVKALYSVDTEPRAGTVVVECSGCLEHTRISLLDAGVRIWSLSLWIPGKRFSRHLSCPACGRRTWCRVRWTA